MPKLVLISDTHGHHEHVRVPPGDLLIHAGDFTRNDQGRKEFREFLQWLERQPCPRKVLVSGNHDSQTERFPDLARQMIAEYAPSVTYLRDSGVEIDGLKLWGSPYTPTFYQWFNMRDRGEAIKRHWDLIPDDTDVLITHGPPKMIAGKLDWTSFGKEHCGCADLMDAILRVKPTIWCGGHVHGGYGIETLVHADGSKSTLYNASICNEAYRPVNQPWVVNL